MAKKLADFLKKRQEEIEKEKNTQEQIVANVHKAQAHYKDIVQKVIHPTMNQLAKVFSDQGYILTLKRDISPQSLDIDYLIVTSDTNPKKYTISFFGHRENVDALFHVHGAINSENNYTRRFTFDEITPEVIEEEITLGLEHLLEKDKF